MKFPTTSGKGVIYKMRVRVMSLIQQMQKIPAEREKAMAKAKVAPKEVTPAAADAVEVYNLEEELLAVKRLHRTTSSSQVFKNLRRWQQRRRTKLQFHFTAAVSAGTIGKVVLITSAIR